MKLVYCVLGALILLWALVLLVLRVFKKGCGGNCADCPMKNKN